MFKKYQRLPKTVEAVQFTEANKDKVFVSLTGQFCADHEDGRPILKITTVHGEVAIVRVGDWIVKDQTLGTYYPVKDDIFRVGYDPAQGVENKEQAASLLYVVSYEGVYRQEILGVFDGEEKAVEAAELVISEEEDDYHEVHIGTCELNTLIEDVTNIHRFRKSV